MLKMKIHKVSPESQRYGVRLYAQVESRTNPDSLHNVVFIRKSGTRRWLCDCFAQVFIETGRRRNCQHIRAVRKNLNR